MHGKQVNNQHMKSTLDKDVKKLQKRIIQHSENVEGELVHDIRVICKRVRAELLLLKSKSKQSRLKKISKEIAGSLSSIRDAEVMLDTFDSFFRDVKSDSLNELRKKLESERYKQNVDADSLLKQLSRLKLELKGRSYTQKAEGRNHTSIDATKEKSREKYKKLDSTNRETFHEWRKAVKAYLYLMKLNNTESHAKLPQVKELAECLGLLHDLYVFDEVVSKRYAEFTDYLREPFSNRERELLNEIHCLATEVYEIDGDVFQTE